MTIVEVMVAFLIILMCVAALMGVMRLASNTLMVSSDFDNDTTALAEDNFADKDYSYDAISHKIKITENPAAISGGTRETTSITFQEVGNAGSTFTIPCSRVQTTDMHGRTYYVYTKTPVVTP
ncbi:MAG: hypothetical protein PUD20_09065 [bacterium]|nr:hypothetical protein [bacterium]